MVPFNAQAAIFDMDGVLVDTIPLHYRAWQTLAAKLGKTFSYELLKLGNGTTYLTHILAMKWTECPDEGRRLAEERETTYQEIIREVGVKAMPGVVDYLEKLKHHSIPCAVGTSAFAVNQHITLRAAGLENYFNVFVNGDDVAMAKPAPDIFLKAAERLGVEPNRCVVFEDAPLGIQAGKAADMHVVAFSFTHPAEELQQADLIVDSFAAISFS